MATDRITTFFHAQCPYEPVSDGFCTRYKLREASISGGGSGQQFLKYAKLPADRGKEPVNIPTMSHPACSLLVFFIINSQ